MKRFVRGEGMLANVPAHHDPQRPQSANDRRRLAASQAKVPVPGTPRKTSALPAPSANPAFGAPPPNFMRPQSALSQSRNVNGHNGKGKNTGRQDRDVYDTDAESLDTTIHGARSIAKGVVQAKDSQAPDFTQEQSDNVEPHRSDDEGDHHNSQGGAEDDEERIDIYQPPPPTKAFLDRRLMLNEDDLSPRRSPAKGFLDRRLMLNEDDLKSYPTTTSGRMEDDEVHEGGASSEPEADLVHSPSPQKHRGRSILSHFDEAYGAPQARQPTTLPMHSTVSTRRVPEIGESRSKSYPDVPTQDSEKPQDMPPIPAQNQLHVSDHARQQATLLRTTNKPQSQKPVKPIARPKSAANRPHQHASQATALSQMAPPSTYGLHQTQPPAYSQAVRNLEAIDIPARGLLKPVNGLHQATSQPNHINGNAQPQRYRDTSPTESHDDDHVEDRVEIHSEDHVEDHMAIKPYEDYDPPVLFEMDYSELKAESFDTIPRGNPSPLSADLLKGPLPQRLDHVHQNLSREDQHTFFNSITTHEWEEAGDWFLSHFGNIVKRMTEARKEKRKRAMDFEDEVEKRHQHVTKRQKTVQDAMAKMRNKGQTLLPPRSPRRDL